MRGQKTISPQELSELVTAGRAAIIDVRTPVEFREVHARGADNVPLAELDPNRVMQGRNANAEQPLYVMCKTGGRAARACAKFAAAGYADVVSVEGGTDAWEAAGLPVVHGQKSISLERQVRIAAGSIVLVGAVLAITVHPYFAGICAFIGAGLVFAGVTDTCGMAMMLARMPWNQVRGDCAT